MDTVNFSKTSLKRSQEAAASTDLARKLEATHNALRARDVAELLGVSAQHIYKLAAKGLIPSFRVGTAVRFDPAAVAAWIGAKMLPHSLGTTDKIKIAV
jgi:excisionase family DNA binding protein